MLTGSYPWAVKCWGIRPSGSGPAPGAFPDVHGPPGRKASGSAGCRPYPPDSSGSCRNALLRKTDFVVTESGTQLAGAYYIRVQRELQVVEDAKVAELLDTLYPQFTAWQRARQEAANCPAESSGRVGSTGEARARQAAQAQRNKAAQAAAEQAQLAADILSSLTKGEFEIREIYAYANASLVTYSKAAKFKVIREEIPCFNASFSAESAAKQLGLKEEGGTE